MVKTYWKELVLLLLTVTVFVLGYSLWQIDASGRVMQPQASTSEQTRSIKYCQQKTPTVEAVRYIEKDPASATQPVTIIIMQTPASVEDDIKQHQRVENSNGTVPTVVLEKPETKSYTPEQKVVVYRVNSHQDDAVKVETLYVDDKAY
jgi:hypothetical protein